MNLPIHNPPQDWSVSETNGVIRIEHGGPQQDLKSQAIGVFVAAGFMVVVVVAIRLWNRAELADALFGWPTLVVLLPLAAVTAFALYSHRKTGSDRVLLLEPGKLTIHSRFGKQRETVTVERSRLLRFIRAREEDPADPDGTIWWLDFEARGSGPDPDEIYIGSFLSREDVEWFTALFERWSGLRVKDELMKSEPDPEDEEPQSGENGHP
jgi:hypothetical protein